MPRTKAPTPSKHTGEINLDPIYFQRIIPQWGTPEYLNGETWRRVVASQPLALIFRDTLINHIVNLEWKIEPRDASKRDELSRKIDYYTRLFENDGNYDWVSRCEWVLKDCLDLPIGGLAEIGREYDEPNGKVLWIEPIDGATTFPTLNMDYPIGQTVDTKTIYFPAHAINRIYLSPRTEMRRKGYGLAPPERIYMALEFANRGDKYYANFLMDTPEVGILDLGDMARDSAQEWVKSWRGMLNGIDPFKIPVLYEHEKPAQFISFNRSPTEIMFDKATAKYASLIAGGYGMTLSDIGFSANSNGGDTLAGSIRQERMTRKNGLALIKKKLELFYNRILPDSLCLKWVDLDDELAVALGRARLATATALQILVDKHILLPNEARAQIISDGLITVGIPENIEGGDEFPEQNPQTQERPGLLGKPISPSQGGYGEVRSEVDDLTDF